MKRGLRELGRLKASRPIFENQDAARAETLKDESPWHPSSCGSQPEVLAQAPVKEPGGGKFPQQAEKFRLSAGRIPQSRRATRERFQDNRVYYARVSTVCDALSDGMKNPVALARINLQEPLGYLAVLADVRSSESRFDHRNADAKPSHFVVQGFRITLERVFSRGVDRLEGRRHEYYHRAHIRNAPIPLPTHYGQNRAARSQNAKDIRFEKIPSFFDAGFL